MESPIVDKVCNSQEEHETNCWNIKNYRRISDVILSSLNHYSRKPFLGNKLANSYKWITYEYAKETILKLKKYFTFQLKTNSDIFKKFEFNNKEHFMIGIYTNPAPENLIFMMALNLTRITILPIFNTIRENNLNDILTHSEIRCLIVDYKSLEILINDNFLEKEKIDEINGKNKNHLTYLKYIILIDTKENGMSDVFANDSNEVDNIGLRYDLIKTREYMESRSIKLILLSELLKSDEEFTTEYINSNSFQSNEAEEDEEDIILLNYTTSINNIYGQSMKGVLTSEKTLMSTFNSLIRNKQYELSSLDTYYSLISIADLPEYLNNLIAIYNGIKIGYYSGQPCNIFDDIKALQPTILYLYPRVLSKISEAIQSIINKLDETKKNIITNAIKIKINCLLEHGGLDHHIWDKLLFKKIKDFMGGNIRLIIVGGGHLNSNTLHFLKVCLNTSIMEIYGVTECCGIIALSDFNSLDNKYIGNSIDSVLVCLLKYSNLGLSDLNIVKGNNNQLMINSGEICVKGNIFSGYYKFAKKEEAVDANGYFHTGDYGILYEDMNDNSVNLKLVDKIKDIMVTSTGFLISPSVLEDIYIQSEYVSDISIVQDHELNLVGMVVLNKDKFFSTCNDTDNFDEESTSCGEKNRKGSIKSKKSENGLGNLNYKSDKNRSRFSKSININHPNLKSLSNNNTPVHLPSKNEQKKEKIKAIPNENKQLINDILKSFKIIWAENKLRSYESIDHIYILNEKKTPSIQNGLLTCKMKLNRENFKKDYLNYLEKIMEEKNFAFEFKLEN